MGDAFPADDVVARYVMRLSMALGDVRVAMDYLVREEQPPYERLYFVRLAALHLRELVLLIDPPQEPWRDAPCAACGKPEPREPFVLPDVEVLIAATRASESDGGKLRAAREEVRRRLAERFELRPVLLRQELRQMRNGFAHYHRSAEGDATLSEAMERATNVESRYVVRENTMRADYADDVASHLVHPFDATDETERMAMAAELHRHIVALLPAVSAYLHLAEAVFLHSRGNAVRWTQVAPD